MFDLEWVARNVPKLARLFVEHFTLSAVPTLLGLVLAVVLGVLCVRWRLLYPLALTLTTVFFAVPSIALFVLLLPFTGLTPTTAMIPLTVYTVCLLLRSVVEGMNGTDDAVRQAATAIGQGTWRRLLTVELPGALPVLFAGLRVAAVANIAMVSIASVIGVSSLGDLFIDGTQRSFLTPIIAGIVLSMALAVLIDLLLVGVQRLVVRWDPEGDAA